MLTDFFNRNGGVVKRNGQIEQFDSNKIRNAIAKAVNASHTEEELKSYDIKKLNNLITEIENDCKWWINNNPNLNGLHVEKIQDFVERQLIKGGYSDTAKEYILYRQKRSEIRRSRDSISECVNELLNTDAKDNDLKRDNGNIDGDTAMGTMLQIGANVSKQYYAEHMMSKDIAKAYREGYIHIHDLDFYALTVTCCQIDCVKLLKDGFNTGHGFLREPNSISSYATLAAIAIQSDQNDCHGGQSIPNFDYSMVPGIYKSFRKAIKENYRKFNEFSSTEEYYGHFIDNIDSDSYIKDLLEFGQNLFNEKRDTETVDEKLIRVSYEDVEKQTYQAMEGFVHNLNTLHSRAGGQVNMVA